MTEAKDVSHSNAPSGHLTVNDSGSGIATVSSMSAGPGGLRNVAGQRGDDLDDDIDFDEVDQDAALNMLTDLRLCQAELVGYITAIRNTYLAEGNEAKFHRSVFLCACTQQAFDGFGQTLANVFTLDPDDFDFKDEIDEIESAYGQMENAHDVDDDTEDFDLWDDAQDRLVELVNDIVTDDGCPITMAGILTGVAIDIGGEVWGPPLELDDIDHVLSHASDMCQSVASRFNLSTPEAEGAEGAEGFEDLQMRMQTLERKLQSLSPGQSSSKRGPVKNKKSYH